ncbi:MAG: hypothetical protein AAF937_03845 [Planctomycetota bacterium]
MGLDDPRAQIAVFGIAGPAAIAFVATLVAAIAFRAGRRVDPGTASPRAGVGAAFGFAAAFVFANLGMDGVPDRWPVAAAEWALPLLALAGVTACLDALIFTGKKRHVVRWAGRAMIIAAFIFGPMSRTWQNFWEGTEAAFWIGGVVAWFAIAFAASDRTASKSTARGHALVAMVTAGGLVPVIFGAGVTVQSQVAGAVAAAAGGIAAATFLARKSVPGTHAMGTAFIAWTAVVLTLSWQFVAEMAWWEFGAVASIPLLVAAVDVVPGLRGLSAGKRLAIRLVVAAAVSAGVSGHHVPGLLEQVSAGADASDPYGDYLESL